MIVKQNDGFNFTGMDFDDFSESAVEFAREAVEKTGIGADALYSGNTAFIIEQSHDFAAAAREAAKLSEHFYGTIMVKPFISQGKPDIDVMVIFRAAEDHICHITVAALEDDDDEIEEALQIAMDEVGTCDRGDVLESLAAHLREKVWHSMHPVLH